MKTIKQIADEIGVSKQAVQQRITSKKLASKIQPLLARENGIIYISEEAETLVKSAFSEVKLTSKPTSKPTSKIDLADKLADNLVGKQTDNTDNKMNTLISMLQEELNVKNEQIRELNIRLAESNAALVSAQQSVSAAQALHAGTIQKSLESGESDQEGKAPRLFQRIFGRKQ